jgi:hypothetical protein
MHECGWSLIVFCPSQTLFISRTSQTQYHCKWYCSWNSPALSEHSSLASGVRNTYKNIATSCCHRRYLDWRRPLDITGRLPLLRDWSVVCALRVGNVVTSGQSVWSVISDSAFLDVSNSTTWRQHSDGWRRREVYLLIKSVSKNNVSRTRISILKLDYKTLCARVNCGYPYGVAQPFGYTLKVSIWCRTSPKG